MDTTGARARPPVRGRPYRPPVDESAYLDPRGGQRVRLAWLLGTSRLTAADSGFHHRRVFVEALNRDGVACDESRVSRWESGAAPIPGTALAGYERLLELPPLSLRATSAWLNGSLPVPSPRRSGGGERRLDQMLDGVLDGAPTGVAWLVLAEELTLQSALFMRPEVWSALIDRLLDELGRSLHLGYMTRHLAARMLVGHPTGQTYATSALLRMARDPHGARVADAIALARHLPGRAASTLVVRLLRTLAPATGEVNESAVHGALRAASSLLASDLFSPDDLPGLEQQLVDAIADPGGHHAAEVAGRLPLASARRLASELLDAGALTLPGRYGEVVDSDTAATVAGQVIALATERAPIGLRHSQDVLFERLVREALFHAHSDRRLSAGLLLMLSPYSEAVAAACAVALEELQGDRDERAASYVVRLLRFCVTRAELPVLLAEAVAGPAEARPHARTALGHVPHALTRQQAEVLVTTLPGSDRREAAATVYALGMHGLADVLRAVPTAPHWAAVEASRWESRGARITA